MRATPFKYIVVAQAYIFLIPAAASLAQEENADVISAACTFQSAANCQSYDDTLNFAISDRHLGAQGHLGADDITVLGTTLSAVCVWGFYIDLGPEAWPNDCGPLVSSDSFRIRVYANDPSNGRMPGNLVGESMANSQREIVPNSLIKTRLFSELYNYQVILDNPITGLVAGETYWLEVSNDPAAFGPPRCTWYWSRHQPTTSSFSFVGSDSGYQPGFEYPADFAFCTNFDLSPSPLGGQTGACCACDGACTAKTLFECDAANRIWDIARADCTTGACASGPPANNDCANSELVFEGEYPFSIECANSDGFFGFQCCDFGGCLGVHQDLWYRYIAPDHCPFVVSLCLTGYRFDSSFAVFHNPSNPTQCPPCPLDLQTWAATKFGDCPLDESCTQTPMGGSGLFVLQDWVQRDALPGECFLIRIGGIPNDFNDLGDGSGVLSISCPTADPAIPLADPSGVIKTRFISFSAPSYGALRVRLSSIHHVVPPYTGGPSVPFTSFEGQVRWVGPPMQYVESTSNATPFYAASLQCMPHYQDWSTVGLLNVTGSAIVPSSMYEVQNVAASCMGNEANCSAVSAPLEVGTTRWGDVEAPYNPPSTTAQPDVGDIAALVGKFRSAPGAPIKARALLAGGDASGNIDISSDLGFSHIAACVDAFRGKSYPYTIQACP